MCQGRRGSCPNPSIEARRRAPNTTASTMGQGLQQHGPGPAAGPRRRRPGLTARASLLLVMLLLPFVVHGAAAAAAASSSSGVAAIVGNSSSNRRRAGAAATIIPLARRRRERRPSQAAAGDKGQVARLRGFDIEYAYFASLEVVGPGDNASVQVGLGWGVGPPKMLSNHRPSNRLTEGYIHHPPTQ